MSSDTYIKAAVKIIEDLLVEDNKGKVLKGSAQTPFPSTYKPEVDVTRDLNAGMVSRYSQLIGILRWAIEIGRLDIYTEKSMLSQHLA